MPDTCPDIMQLERFVLGDLEESSSQSVHGHLSGCTGCSTQVRELEENLRLEKEIQRSGSSIGAHIQTISGPEPTQVGPYRILRKIGQGGMGSVYEAQQEHPQRTVALKMIRPGLVSRSLMSRFRHEAQTLGRLRHPGIAQIYDAGTHNTELGPQPYFAMELVNGQALLDYCQSKDLRAQERLSLLARVCDAVQHAHQRGVIHRDLKPDNILVDESTGEPQPKILDFGVARVVDPDSQQTTLHTSAGQIVGTIAYMSPEQASGSQNEIDTRSDVYALGVIGYQLLSGKLPYKLSMTAIAESVRAIVQDEPQPLSSIDRSLRGDVTTIIGKALSKEKTRRYQSATEMGSDIRRFLNYEPITAHPPSTIYQLRKFARRNKGLVAGIAAAFVVLVLGVIGTSVALYKASRSADAALRETAKQTAINGFLQDLLAAANPRLLSAEDRAKGRDVTVKDALNQSASKLDKGALRDQPEVELAVRRTVANTYCDLGELDAADRHINRAVELSRQLYGSSSAELADSLNSLALVRQRQGRLAEAETAARDALAMSEQVFGMEHINVSRCLNTLALVIGDRGKLGEVQPLLERNLDLRRRLQGEHSEDYATALNNLAMFLDERGKYDEAEVLYEKALKIRRKLLGDEHPNVAVILNNLAFVLRTQNKLVESEAMFRESLRMRTKLFGEEHRDSMIAMNNLASLLQQMGQFEEAERLYVRAIELERKHLGDPHPVLAQSLNNLATLYRDQGKLAEAVPLFEASLAMRRKTVGDKHPAVATATGNLAGVLADLKEYERAEMLATQALDIGVEVFGPDSPDAAAYRVRLGAVLTGRGKFEQAEQQLLRANTVLSPRLSKHDSRALHCVRTLVKLYAAWGKPEQEAQWRQLLPATRPASAPATTRASL